MTKRQKNEENIKQGFRLRLSLDGWAVTVALFLSLLIWSGLVKRIPW